MWELIGMEEFEPIKAIAAKEQPRQPANEPSRRTLPHASPSHQQQSSLLELLPLDCRLLIWEQVLHTPQTRLVRWRPSRIPSYTPPENIDADCFPYRLCTSSQKKTEKPLSLLLCCRHLYLEGLSILYSTTFVFALPRDLYSFQSYASPEGLGRIRSLIIAFGQTDRHWAGPFRNDDPKLSPGTVDEWQSAIQALEKMKRLHELQVLLGHRWAEGRNPLGNNDPSLERRPWKNEDETPAMEERHGKLFELLGKVNVPNFTLHLTWNPKHILSLRQWPFKLNLQTMQDMLEVQREMWPDDTDLNMYGWL